MALSTIKTASIANDAITADKIINDGNLGVRNLIINGAMQVAQRGTSVASSSGSVVRCVDRFRCLARGAGAATFSQTSTVPTGQGFANSLRVDVTTVDSSLDTNDLYMIDQRFEGQDFQQLAKGTSDAKSVTASFWVRSTKTGTYILELFDDDNNRNISKTYSISSADTWEYKTITFEGDTTGALDNDNGASILLRWFLAVGTNYSSGTLATAWEASNTVDRAVGQVNFFDSTSNDFYITGIQLEVGDTATPFEHRSFGDELARCQRYYYQTLTGAAYQRHGLGAAVGTGFVDMPYRLPQTMRTRPSTTKSGTLSIEADTTKSVSAVTISTDSSSADVVRYGITCATSLNIGNAYYLMNGNDANAYITFDAEL